MSKQKAWFDRHGKRKNQYKDISRRSYWRDMANIYRKDGDNEVANFCREMAENSR